MTRRKAKLLALIMASGLMLAGSGCYNRIIESALDAGVFYAFSLFAPYNVNTV
jgi:hypothetical protein